MMKRALDSVNEKILAAVHRRAKNVTPVSTAYVPSSSPILPRLVAVSKLKPNSAIIEAYACGQRYFGENYIQELIDKSNSPDIVEQCPDIRFHFIGHLQSNKVNKLLSVQNLSIVETVDSLKLADLIDRAIEKRKNDISNVPIPNWLADPLKVMIQVNTSGEEQKSGCSPDGVCSLARHIVTSCKRLQLVGLMTIGKFEGWGDQENQDFLRLQLVREKILKDLSMDLELSMGMSGDFEEAIVAGSSSIRVGTLIFGQRDSKH